MSHQICTADHECIAQSGPLSHTRSETDTLAFPLARSQLSEVTPRFVRSQLEQRLGFMKDELASQKKEISSAIQEALADMQVREHHAHGTAVAVDRSVAQDHNDIRSADMTTTVLFLPLSLVPSVVQSGVKSEPAPVASFSALSSTPAATPASRSAESQKQLNASKKRALSAAAGDEDDFDSDDDGAAKRRKSEASNGPHVTVVGAPDPNTVKLSDNKRIEVRVFKKMVLIDIRETYTDKTSGEEKPGKKGQTDKHRGTTPIQ